jgi:hypothetical protein
MVVDFTNQLPIAFREGCRGQVAHPEEMVLVICTSSKDLTLLKNYFPIYPYLRILVVGKLGQPETNVEG